MKEVLEHCDIKFEEQKYIHTSEQSFRVDFVINTTIIEIDSDTHNEEYDIYRDSIILKEKGYKTIRLSLYHNDFFDDQLEEIIKFLQAHKIIKCSTTIERQSILKSFIDKLVESSRVQLK